MIRHRHMQRPSVGRLTLREAHSEVWTRPSTPGDGPQRRI